ncbi:caspase family protein [Allorhizocola rhizosphaerae]|uniref:caspase family protein n=1 Tax=Allorhizocola rhizosphaerae TaxID=1872709 RepID=UPI001FE9FF41|nr:caspase family protein [Allorhizocola rhizosphaerae]
MLLELQCHLSGMDAWMTGGTYVGVGVVEYDCPEYATLEQAKIDVERMTAVLTGQGFHSRILMNPRAGHVTGCLHPLDPGHSDALVIYWAGHGVFAGQDDLRLILSDTSAHAAQDETQRPGALVERAILTGATQIIVLIDACFSGAAVVEAIEMAAQMAPSQPAGVWVGVVATAQSFGTAIGGRFAEAMERILTTGPHGDEFRLRWSVHNQDIRADELVQAVNDEWVHDDQQLGSANSDSRGPYSGTRGSTHRHPRRL